MSQIGIWLNWIFMVSDIIKCCFIQKLTFNLVGPIWLWKVGVKKVYPEFILPNIFRANAVTQVNGLDILSELEGVMQTLIF